jgi:F-type H+-transporting ATPase subunit b
LRFKSKSPAAWLLSFALTSAFVFAVVAAPQRTFAQEAATQSQPAAQPAQKSSQPEPEKEGGEDVDNFLHTKLVASIGKEFGLDVNASARLFEWLNTIIILLAIVLPLAKLLPKMLRKRSETLKQNLEEARKSTADANTRLSAVEAQLSKLDEEIAKIRQQFDSEIAQDEARIKSTIGEETARIVAAAEQEITVAAAQAQRGLKAFAADLAIDQAVKQLTLTAENDRALIEEFVAHADNGGNR